MKIFSQIRLGGMLITPFFIVVQKTNEIIGPKPSKILFFSGSYDDILSIGLEDMLISVDTTPCRVRSGRGGGGCPPGICKKSDVQKYILYVFLPAAGGKFLEIFSPEIQFLKGFEGYLTSKSQKNSPAAQLGIWSQLTPGSQLTNEFLFGPN